MEPSIPEEPSPQVHRGSRKPSDATGSGGGTQTLGRSTNKLKFYTDVPSVKYPDVEIPTSKATLRRAVSPPRATLPRRATTRTWNATAKERNPLASCLTGPGRAGKYGELITEKGGKYEGEVLAGRPHGQGKYFVRTASRQSASPWTLEYEGSWMQGIREGHGTRFYSNGETYEGDFTAGVRHGHGKYTFTNNDVYAGEWVDDRRTGHGTYFYANGDVFVGNFINDRKEGRGTLYMMSRQRKYIAEYVHNQPKCGTVLNIEDEDLEPLQGQLRTMTLTAKLDLSATGTLPQPLPDLEVLQPNKVLAAEVVAVRKMRAEGGKDMRLVQAHSGTLSSKEIEMLRHSFTLMAAGDGPKNGLLPHQLRELIVMAGLDPAVPATRQLVDRLLGQRDTGPSGRISFDNFLKVVVNFQEEANQVHVYGQEQQQQQWQEGQEEVQDLQQQAHEAEGGYDAQQIPAHWEGQQYEGEQPPEEQEVYAEAEQSQEPGVDDMGQAAEEGPWGEEEEEAGTAAVPDAGPPEVVSEGDEAAALAEAEAEAEAELAA